MLNLASYLKKIDWKCDTSILSNINSWQLKNKRNKELDVIHLYKYLVYMCNSSELIYSYPACFIMQSEQLILFAERNFSLVSPQRQLIHQILGYSKQLSLTTHLASKLSPMQFEQKTAYMETNLISFELERFFSSGTRIFMKILKDCTLFYVFVNYLLENLEKHSSNFVLSVFRW